MRPIFTSIHKMVHAQSIENANDAQLRQLAKHWQFQSEYKQLLLSSLPLTTTERSSLVNLLKAHGVFQFVITN